jgi:alkyl hydroperoxide reductase subunit AhpC
MFAYRLGLIYPAVGKGTRADAMILAVEGCPHHSATFRGGGGPNSAVKGRDHRQAGLEGPIRPGSHPGGSRSRREVVTLFNGHVGAPSIRGRSTLGFSGRRTEMALQIGDTAPDFQAETTEGAIGFHDWIGDSWAVLFSHPKDFTPVCTTELGYMAKIKPEFDRRNVKIIGISVDSTSDHEAWAKDIEETQGAAPNYPIVGDHDFKVSKLYGMLPADVSGDPKTRTPADNQTVRNVFVVGPDKQIKLILVYPMTTGRNFDEVLRVIDSLQLTAKHKVSTPVNWKQGEDVIIAGSVSNDEAKEIFGEWQSPKPYIRIVPQPSD